MCDCKNGGAGEGGTYTPGLGRQPKEGFVRWSRKSDIDVFSFFVPKSCPPIRYYYVVTIWTVAMSYGCGFVGILQRKCIQ